MRTVVKIENGDAVSDAVLKMALDVAGYELQVTKIVCKKNKVLPRI